MITVLVQNSLTTLLTQQRMSTTLSRPEVCTTLAGQSILSTLEQRSVDTGIAKDESFLTSITSEPHYFTTIGSPGPQGPPGPVGESVTTQSHQAGEAISGHRAVRVVGGIAYICDGTLATHIGRCIGITTGAVLSEGVAQVQTAGVLTEPSWNWNDGPVYVGTSGVLTQSLFGLAYVHQIGLAVSPTAIDINPISPILIS